MDGHSHSCGDESHGHHDHDHPEDTSDLGPEDNLYSRVNISNCAVLNATDDTADARNAIKPWNLRNDEQKAIQSDADDQLSVSSFIPLRGKQMF
jgi:hypothetical protein